LGIGRDVGYAMTLGDIGQGRFGYRD
jgi:hypothetical protein